MIAPKPRRKRVVRVELTRAEAEDLHVYTAGCFQSSVWSKVQSARRKLERALKEATK